jgi:hypothetical protein
MTPRDYGVYLAERHKPIRRRVAMKIINNH